MRQEYHTSFWGHLGLLHLDDHFLTPDFASYRHTAMASPYPHNGVIADLAHAQSGLVGYVHPFDWSIVPEKEKSLTHQLPADVINGKVDYLEVVGVRRPQGDRRSLVPAAESRLPAAAGAGTDAMANYASLRGPVGMNRVFLDTGGSRELGRGIRRAQGGPRIRQQRAAARAARGWQKPGDSVRDAGAGQARVPRRAALVRTGRSPRTGAERPGPEGLHPLGRPTDISTPKANWNWTGAAGCCCAPGTTAPIRRCSTCIRTRRTNPIYLKSPAGAPSAQSDAAYFAAWIDRVICGREGTRRLQRRGRETRDPRLPAGARATAYLPLAESQGTISP